MAAFQYSASDIDGKIVRGTATAADKHQLSLLLQEQGLFLVSCVDLDAPAPAEDAQAATSPSEKPLDGIEDDRTRLSDDKNNYKQKRLLVALFICSVVVGLWR